MARRLFVLLWAIFLIGYSEKASSHLAFGQYQCELPETFSDPTGSGKRYTRFDRTTPASITMRNLFGKHPHDLGGGGPYRLVDETVVNGIVIYEIETTMEDGATGLGYLINHEDDYISISGIAIGFVTDMVNTCYRVEGKSSQSLEG